MFTISYSCLIKQEVNNKFHKSWHKILEIFICYWFLIFLDYIFTMRKCASSSTLTSSTSSNERATRGNQVEQFLIKCFDVIEQSRVCGCKSLGSSCLTSSTYPPSDVSTCTFGVLKHFEYKMYILEYTMIMLMEIRSYLSFLAEFSGDQTTRWAL